MQRILHMPGRLQWRLTLSYTLITLVTAFLVEVLTVLVVLGYFFLNQSSVQVASFQAQANQAYPYFVHGRPDQVELQAWLRVSEKLVEPQLTIQQGFVCVIDMRHTVLASIGHAAPVPATPLYLPGSTLSDAQLHTVLLGHRSSVVSNEPQNMLLIVVPVQSEAQRPVAALVALVPGLTLANTINNYGHLAAIVGINIVLLTLLVGLVGTIFGFWTARGFTRRFMHLAQATDGWSQGDFSTLIKDPVADEIGQLARRMDRMAEQLQQLLRTRQQLATIEVRNRLARDLHDSVKQQVFSVAMQLGTLRILLTRDTEKAQQRLTEIERTVKLAQQELTALIRELRPVALEDRSFEQALQDLAAQWMQQTWITAVVELEHEESNAADSPSTPGVRLTENIEDALFRIVQEALSNVARHSNATHVLIRCCTAPSRVVLTIKDNGRGFPAIRENLARYDGVGLRSMQERIQALHGSIEFRSVENAGTTIEITCPIPVEPGDTVKPRSQEVV